jgi:flagellar basal body L-ring protein FlgH
MANYTKTTNFAAKDALASGNASKVVKGTEIDTEFTNIQTAIASKADGTFTNFSFVESSNVLYIYNVSTPVAKIDSSGNLTVIGNIVANGTM